MTLDQRALALAEQVGTDIRSLVAMIGSLNALTTDDKTSIVGAVNSILTGYNAVVDFITAQNAKLNDELQSATNIWSADKIIGLIANLKEEILNGAPGTFDTLKEIADYLSNNDLEVTQLINNLSGTIRIDAAQNLEDGQQQQACDNINVGNKNVDLRSIYWTNSDVNTYVAPGYVVPGYFK